MPERYTIRAGFSQLLLRIDWRIIWRTLPIRSVLPSRPSPTSPPRNPHPVSLESVAFAHNPHSTTSRASHSFLTLILLSREHRMCSQPSCFRFHWTSSTFLLTTVLLGVCLHLDVLSGVSHALRCVFLLFIFSVVTCIPLLGLAVLCPAQALAWATTS